MYDIVKQSKYKYKTVLQCYMYGTAVQSNKIVYLQCCNTVQLVVQFNIKLKVLSVVCIETCKIR